MRKGVIIDETTGDLLIDPVIEDGLIKQGIVVAQSDKQNVDFIVSMAKGELKERPAVGVGIINFLKSTGNEREMIRSIKVQIEMDGYNSNNVTLKKGKLNIEI